MSTGKKKNVKGMKDGRDVGETEQRGGEKKL